jgi:RNA polymerase sigma factor (sigma-70 family)
MSTILHTLTQLVSTELTDGQLLGRYVTTRDAAAFEILVRRHGPMVLGVCRRLLRDLHDAEDAFQATFLVLVRKATTITPREAVGSWLYGVAYRTAQKVRVAAARRRSKEVQVAQVPEPTTALEGLWHDVLPLLDHELALLPEKYRLPIVLCDLEGKTRKEAARQLGWPEGTVAGHLASARKMLAKRLARHGVPLSAGVLAAVLSESGTQAALPLTLVLATVRKATGGVMQAGISSVAEGVVRTMFLSNLKLPVIVLVAITAIAAGAALVIGGPQQADKPGGVPGTPAAPGVAQKGVTPPALEQSSPLAKSEALKLVKGSDPGKGSHEGQPDVAEETAWGEAVDGLQAGVAVNKHDFCWGETATFTVKVRNVSDATITASYVSGVPDRTTPGVTSAANAQPRVLMPAQPGMYRPTVSRSLKPGEVFELGTARLRVQAAFGNDPAPVPRLAATPGKYQVAYSGLAFAGTAGPDKVWVATGKVEIEILGATKAAEKAEAVSWGEADEDGLQAGLAYPHNGNHAYHLGEQVTFVVWLRNVSGQKAAVSFWSRPEDDAGPMVVGQDRKPRQAYPTVKSTIGQVIAPPVWHYSPQVVERILQPGEVMELGRPTLWLVAENPSKKVAHPTLVAAPGSFRVHYAGLAGEMEFATGMGLLDTGSVDLEVKAGGKAAEESDPRPSDLSGNWQAVSLEHDGRQKFTKEAARKVTASFHDCRYHMTPLPWGPKDSFDGTYQIDGDAEEPKSFSLYPAEGILKGQPFRGIYRVEGDTLTLCFSWPPLDRPTEFRSRPNSTIVLAVFKRAKP